MPSQAERETNFIWRPSDNSVQTNLRYDLEAEKWFLAYQGARRKHTRPSFQESVGFVGLLLSLVFNLIWLMGFLVVRLFKWVRKQ